MNISIFNNFTLLVIGVLFFFFFVLYLFLLQIFPDEKPNPDQDKSLIEPKEELTPQSQQISDQLNQQEEQPLFTKELQPAQTEEPVLLKKYDLDPEDTSNPTIPLIVPDSKHQTDIYDIKLFRMVGNDYSKKNYLIEQELRNNPKITRDEAIKVAYDNLAEHYDLDGEYAEKRSENKAFIESYKKITGNYRKYIKAYPPDTFDHKLWLAVFKDHKRKLSLIQAELNANVNLTFDQATKLAYEKLLNNPT